VETRLSKLIATFSSILYNILEKEVHKMPQISLYVDTKTLKKIEKAAELSNTSISKWVTGKLTEHLEQNWPDSFKNLYGSIEDNSFCAETIKDFSMDAERENL
jgi:hypothetical protein